MKLNEMTKTKWWKPTAIVIGVILVATWLAVVPGVGKSDGAVQPEGAGVEGTWWEPGDPHDSIDDESAAEIMDKACPRDDPCMLRPAKWGSPKRMAKKFRAGRLGNAKQGNGNELPIRIQKIASKKWNATHNKAEQVTEIENAKAGYECSHWWCKAWKASQCTIYFYACVYEERGWSGVTSVAFRCQGAALIGGGAGFVADLQEGRPPVLGTIAGAGGGGGACMYDTIWNMYGW